jgi:hypothetical protein
VLVSNLDLIAFVRHLVKLVKQVLQSALRGGKLRQRPHGLLYFFPLTTAKPSDAPSPFIENICLTGYIGGQKSTS